MLLKKLLQHRSEEVQQFAAGALANLQLYRRNAGGGSDASPPAAGPTGGGGSQQAGACAGPAPQIR